MNRRRQNFSITAPSSTTRMRFIAQRPTRAHTREERVSYAWYTYSPVISLLPFPPIRIGRETLAYRKRAYRADRISLGYTAFAFKENAFTRASNKSIYARCKLNSPVISSLDSDVSRHFHLRRETAFLKRSDYVIEIKYQNFPRYVSLLN